MKVAFVDLKAQRDEIRGDLQTALDSVLNDAAFIGGSYLKQFEQEFAGYTNTGHCVGVGNGTDALHVALHALGVGSGDEVITCLLYTSDAADE